MENKEKQLTVLREKLENYKAKGKKEVTLELAKFEADYLVQLGYVIEPYLYKIWTKQFDRYRSINNSLIRDIHIKNMEKRASLRG